MTRDDPAPSITADSAAARVLWPSQRVEATSAQDASRNSSTAKSLIRQKDSAWTDRREASMGNSSLGPAGG
jgi:hypothetical protein